ncbi:hypothetical protein JCM8547_009290 [Rhodosporidiobolus lusitaniae]
MAESGQWKESISLEETNKIRISLGLKPIADPAASSSSITATAALEGDALAEDNYAQKREAERQAKEADALKARIDKARNQKDRAKKLVGRGLGDADEDETMAEKVKQEAEGDDTKAWVKKQKKRAKEQAAKRAREQEEADRLALEEEEARAEKYGAADLKGLKVAHGADAFEEGEEAVLTLKDSRILDDEDDELHNVNLTENAKHAHALELKKKGRQAGQYTGFDDDEFEGGSGASRGVLSKYDEGFEGMKVDGFQLGDAPVIGKGKGKAAGGAPGEDGGEREKVKLSMDYTKSFTTDYLQEGDVGFKKPKKKKKRPARTTTLGDDEPAAADSASMDVDGAPAPRKQIERVSLDDTNLIDDDDLAATLARQRREAAKQKIKDLKKRGATVAPPEAVEDAIVKKEDEDEDAMASLPRKAAAAEEEDVEGDVLVLDDTSEFVRNISVAAAAAEDKAKRDAERAARQATAAAATPAPVVGGAESVMPVIKREEDIPLDEIGGWGEPREDGEEDEQMYDADAAAAIANGAVDEADVKPVVKPDDDDDGLATTGQEKLVSRGLASTLSMLRHQGLVKTRTAEDLQREKELKEREAWLAAQRQRERDRELERLESRKMGDQKTQQQREYENRQREQRDAQASLDAFSNYKPVVNLTYHDEFGRDMTPKEAWKHLSHAFHGHGSGAKKTDKRLKKIENERKAAAMAAGDTPLSTAAAFSKRAEMLGSATMILGVGNNNSAPIQEDTLDNVSKSEKHLKGKGKAVVPPPPISRNGRNPSALGVDTVFDDIPMRPLPLPSASATASGSASSATFAAPASPEPSSSAAPVKRSGFAPVRSFTPAEATPEPGEGGGGPGLGGGGRFAIAVKRKATGEGEGSPAGKRRG